MSANEVVVANLLRYRRRLGMSQAAVAGKLTALGHAVYHPQTVHKIEAGQRKVSVNDLAALAELFGVAPGDLMMPPSPCLTCQDKPPAGFTCQECGTAGEPPEATP